MKIVKFILVGFVALFFMGTKSLVAQNKPEEKTVRYEVSMHCNSCKSKIERDLAFEKGVKEVKADLEQKVVTVKYSEGKISEDKIAEAIKKLGYEVKVIAEVKKDEPIKK